ncbi:GntR family transcriptional regulator [Pseudonocardia sp. DSM 110487]|uniref:GntR family transcriptional regulator n=1 Tax=Pseudonocardia sp. DSM 110487 TaxID=2865833 RepID=UPI001C6A777E|nr:GntR family transcriptional regulator [Pseudonocardia sp. DSM 110487]QYN33925.1 GntR family transcriptional regulator [Pseudonocardia sp. DSM 110487]
MTAEPHAVSAGLGRDLVRLVRSLILTGEIKPGEKILPRDIQARFGVSHIPVREALRALEAEGLVVTVPRRGTTAADVSLAELREVYAMRRLLEPPLMARAVTIRTDEQVAAAQAARRHLAAESGSDVDAWLGSHQAFHRKLIEPAVHGIGRRVLDQLATVAERYVRLSVASLNADVLSAHDHDTLLEAFVAQDASLAERETVHHLELVESTIVEALTDLR